MPYAVVKAGDIVTVKVMELDAARKRIALSMRLDDALGQESTKDAPKRSAQQPAAKPAPAAQGSMAALLTQAMQKKKS